MCIGGATVDASEGSSDLRSVSCFDVGSLGFVFVSAAFDPGLCDLFWWFIYVMFSGFFRCFCKA